MGWRVSRIGWAPVSDQIRQLSNQISICRTGLVDEAEYPAHERACHDLSWR
jgi:hypothetical protein